MCVCIKNCGWESLECLSGSGLTQRLCRDYTQLSLQFRIVASNLVGKSLRVWRSFFRPHVLYKIFFEELNVGFIYKQFYLFLEIIALSFHTVRLAKAFSIMTRIRVGLPENRSSEFSFRHRFETGSSSHSVSYSKVSKLYSAS